MVAEPRSGSRLRKIESHAEGRLCHTALPLPAMHIRCCRRMACRLTRARIGRTSRDQNLPRKSSHGLLRIGRIKAVREMSSRCPTFAVGR